MKELKPCPFCGATPVMRGYRDGYFLEGLDLPEGIEQYIQERWWVSCETKNCVAYHMFEYSSRDKAVKAWNTRYEE